jgi:mRNA-degrading endonuclease toxin of MazEF toxin-antitoxin module
MLFTPSTEGEPKMTPSEGVAGPFGRGDVVLVRTLLPGRDAPSLRPALLLATETYRQGRGQVVVAAVTGASDRLLPGDTAVEQWREAGLRDPSVVTGVVLTMSVDSVDSRLGALSASDLRAVEASLRLSLGL